MHNPDIYKIFLFEHFYYFLAYFTPLFRVFFQNKIFSELPKIIALNFII